MNAITQAFRNDTSSELSKRHIATLQTALTALGAAELDADARTEAERLLQGMIVILSCDEHACYRLHNAAAGLR
jgi:hypothetical protein